MKTSNDSSSVNVNIKIPRKVIHFSDGIIEEFSEDENEDCQYKPSKVGELGVDPEWVYDFVLFLFVFLIMYGMMMPVNSGSVKKTLSWGPWMRYKAWSMGTSTLAAMDYVGETLAYFFGITTPKYRMEIDEYDRIQRRLKKEQEEAKGWTETSMENPETNQPSGNSVV